MYKKVFRCMKVISLKETRDVELRFYQRNYNIVVVVITKLMCYFR